MSLVASSMTPSALRFEPFVLLEELLKQECRESSESVGE